MRSSSPSRSLAGAFSPPVRWGCSPLSEVSLRPLAPSDLPLLSWAGSKAHLQAVSEALSRTRSREVVYLGVFDGPSPVSVGALDFAAVPGSGYLYQLVTLPSLRSRGYGTLLLSGLEIAARPRVSRLELGVEDGNERALSFYLRAGFVPFSRDVSSWEAEDERGRRYQHTVPCTMLERFL